MTTPLSIDDLLAATQTIAMEARTQSINGQIAVGAVLLNRLKRPKYFKCSSIWEVCHAPWQFSCWNNSSDKNLEAVMNMMLNNPVMIESMKAFLTAFEGVDPTNGADHYFADYIAAPDWAKPKNKTIQIGTHIFYKIALG